MRIRSIAPWLLAAAVLAPAAAFADGSDVFGDVPDGSFYDASVGNIVAAGVTSGCQGNPPLYCPNSPTTRAEMAVFLDRILGNPNPVVDAATLGGRAASAFLPAGRVDFGDNALVQQAAITRSLDLGAIPDGATITGLTIRAQTFGPAPEQFNLSLIHQPYMIGDDFTDNVQTAFVGGIYNTTVTEHSFTADNLLAAGLSTLVVDHDAGGWVFENTGTNYVDFMLLNLRIEYALPG